MDEEIICSSLQEYFETLLEKSKGVFSVFCDVFGEDRCDIQVNSGYRSGVIRVWGDPSIPKSYSHIANLQIFRGSRAVDIIVYFPEVEISNERNQSHTIKELYVRTSLKANGKAVGAFEMLRTRYTSQELAIGYKHSHTPRIVRSGDFGFTECCLGEAPIRSTLAELISKCDLDRWNVYCLQLDQYVGIESLNGGPYINLSSIGVTIDRSTYILYDWDAVMQKGSAQAPPSWLVYKFLLTTDIEFAFRDGILVPKMSALEFALRLTQILKSCAGGPESNINKGVLIGNRLYRQSPRTLQVSQIRDCEGRNLIQFKGEEKYLSVDWDEESSVEETELITPFFLYSIMESILIYINTLRNEDRNAWGSISKFCSLS